MEASQAAQIADDLQVPVQVKASCRGCSLCRVGGVVPRRRWKISNSECFRYKSVIRELNRGGARLELGPLQPQTLEVSFFDCYARTVERGSVYVTSLSILGLAQRTILTCFELASAQFDLMVDFSEESWLSRAEEKIYRLPDQTTFHRNEVLNHRTGRNGIV